MDVLEARLSELEKQLEDTLTNSGNESGKIQRERNRLVAFLELVRNVKKIEVDKEYECLNGIIGLNRDIVMKLVRILRRDLFTGEMKIKSVCLFLFLFPFQAFVL
jgi:hypothetical protein